ncbi:defensin-like protein 1 [Cannabis sativa]|uniref:defensin-like protein 1 n=1 Tax=Cannabis sativa TaxID=3483 RepID=UPI0011DFC343|nr:defensin-like protein 1 [Cannabis sativa]
MEMRKVRGFNIGVVLLMILLVCSWAEGRVCESKSHHFKGLCVIDHNCATICRTEGFSGGNCQGFRQRCFCTRHC